MTLQRSEKCQMKGWAPLLGSSTEVALEERRLAALTQKRFKAWRCGSRKLETEKVNRGEKLDRLRVHHLRPHYRECGRKMLSIARHRRHQVINWHRPRGTTATARARRHGLHQEKAFNIHGVNWQHLPAHDRTTLRLSILRALNSNLYF